jgi:hypothetical protein
MPAFISWRSLYAVLIYTVLSLLIIEHGRSLSQQIAGRTNDPLIFIWFFAWWPFAIAHHVSLLHTDLVWFPAGISVFWTTCAPLLSALFAPVTLTAGPVVAYNVAVITAPIVSAWAAWRLYLHVAGDEAAALIAGYLYGFSSYVMMQDETHLNLSFVPCPTLLLIMCLDRLGGRLTRLGFIWRAAALLIAQFMICQEVAATCVMFGAIAGLLAFVCLPAWRAALRRTGMEMIAAGGVTIALLSPVLISMAKSAGSFALPSFFPYFFATDLANILLPAQTNLFGWFAGSSIHTPGLDESGEYLGLAWAAMLAGFVSTRSGALPRYLFILFIVLIIASLGPILWIDDHATPVLLPWFAMLHVPLIGHAFPARFSLFVTLVGGLMAAIFMAQKQHRFARIGVGLLACVSLLPRPHPWTQIPHAVFFRAGHVESVLGTGRHLLILPFAEHGPSSFWQVEDGFGFAQTGGYLGFPPPAMMQLRAVADLFVHGAPAPTPGELEAYIQASRTDTIVIGPGTAPNVVHAIGALAWPTRRVDDVTLVAVPPHG